MYGRVAIYLCIHVWSAHRNLENIVNALRSFAPLIALYHKKKYTISQLKLISIYFKYTLSGRNTVSAIKNNFTLIHKNSV